MGDRITNRQVLKHKAESLSEPEIAEVLDYINIMESLREQASKPDLFDDELMNLLADALENRRARVVTEWDRVRRRADNRASTFVSPRKLMSPDRKPDATVSSVYHHHIAILDHNSLPSSHLLKLPGHFGSFLRMRLRTE